MPSNAIMKLPKTKSWEEFDLIAKDVFSKMINTYFQSFGRKGQMQNGADSYVNIYNNEYIMVQCKNYLKIKGIKSVYKIIDEEVEKLESLSESGYNITKFYIVTALDLDVKIQKYVNEKCIDRVENGKFPIYIWFWDDIEQWILSDVLLFNKYYPTLYNLIKNMIALMDLSFLGSTLFFQVNSVLGDRPVTSLICDKMLNSMEFFKNEYTKNRFNCNLSRLRELLNGELSIEYVENLRNTPIFLCCEEIKNCVYSLESSLSYMELPYYKLGIILGKWDVSINNQGNWKLLNNEIEYFWSIVKSLPIPEYAYEIIEKYIEIMVNTNEDNFKRYSIPCDIYEYIVKYLY